MALQVWLPLNKENDFLNRGLADITVTNSGASYNSAGKIGGCYKETSSINLNYKLNYYENSYSLCTWVKFNSDEIGTILNAITYDNTYSYCSGSILGYNSYGGLDIHWESNNIYSSGSFSSFKVYGTIRYTNYSNSTLTKVLNTDTWYHLVITFNNINKTLSFYINGELFSSITSTIELTAENKTNINSYLNIGCTSGGNAKNSSIPLYYNDVRIYDHCLSPKEVKEISKGLVLHYPLNNSPIKINLLNYSENITEGWGWYDAVSSLSYENNKVKAIGASSGTCRIYNKTFLPYSSSLEYYTIYIDYNLASGTIGISGKSSSSTTSFNESGSQSIGTVTLLKTILLEDNHKISIYKWYRPAATDTIKMPWWMISFPNNQTIYINKIKVEQGLNEDIIYTKYNDSSCYKIYDCSGYSNDGTIKGTLTTSTDTPRYNKCTINSSDYVLKTVFNFPQSSGLTIACWVKLTTWGTLTSGLWSTSTNSDTTCNHRDSAFDIRGTNGTTYRLTCNSTDIPIGTWKHVVFTHNGTIAYLYINGTYIRSLSIPTSLVGFSSFFLGWSLAGGVTRKCQGSWSDLRIYATDIGSDRDGNNESKTILELYNTSAFITDNGTVEAYLFEESPNLVNLLKTELEGITTKLWLGGLSKYTQSNCSCTLEDQGYRIYRPANLTTSANGNTMWGGFVLYNSNNRYNLQDNHTYLLEFDVKGQSSNSIGSGSDFGWSNLVGWNGGGLTPLPTNVIKSSPIVSEYTSDSWQHVSYKWTISDGLYKTCTSSYTSFILGTTYLSYAGFKFGWHYTSTGELGTDIYINNIRMYDITTETPIDLKIEKSGKILITNIIENNDNFFVDSYGEINSNQLIEI